MISVITFPIMQMEITQDHLENYFLFPESLEFRHTLEKHCVEFGIRNSASFREGTKAGFCAALALVFKVK